jgi:hypothetical protein
MDFSIAAAQGGENEILEDVPVVYRAATGVEAGSPAEEWSSEQRSIFSRS